MTQIPPEKRYLEHFNWFDYIRPLSKEDVFVWRPKKKGTELKPQKRREAPKVTLPGSTTPPNSDLSESASEPPSEEAETTESTATEPDENVAESDSTATEPTANEEAAPVQP